MLYLLMGFNGSGKSTLLNILALLYPPDTGTVEFDGSPVLWKEPELSRLRRDLTLVHQSPYLFHGSVRANIAYGLKLRGIHGKSLDERIDWALEQAGLAGFAERKAQQLSGGEARRVALARALALKPRLLLLDEPLANLDKASADLLEKIIADLPSHGTTVVMSTHDQHLRDRLDSREIHLENGRIVD